MPATDDLVVLLPPSEGKAPGGDATVPWRARSGAFAALASARRAVVAAYVDALDGPSASKVTSATGALLERVQDAGRRLRRNTAPSLPASQRFTGVVWEHLHPADVDVERVAIVSGLCGLLAGGDPVPDHRLKLSISLPPLGRLDRWWRPRLTPALDRWAGDRAVWDLLPQEHAAAVDLAALGDRVVRVRFEGVSGHDAKAVKGAFARHLLRTGGHQRFSFHGWRAARDGDRTVVLAAPVSDEIGRRRR